MTMRGRVTRECRIFFGVSWFLQLRGIALFALLFSALFFPPGDAASEIYKWKDHDGNVVFSEAPPSGARAEEVRVRNSMQVERAPSKAGDAPKTAKKSREAAGQKPRDASDISVVMYMTDW